jgi:DnaJ-class molecular chaperone
MNKTAKLTKKTCSRCSGTGNFSFNMIHGSMCYGCSGSGYVMVDEAAEAKKLAAAAKRDAAMFAKAEATRAASEIVINEMNAQLGPFDVATALGVDQLNRAVYLKFGKTIWQIRDQKLRAA